jgi:hypothetical protein
LRAALHSSETSFLRAAPRWLNTSISFPHISR